MIDNDIFERLAEYDNMFYTATQRNYVMFGTLDNKKKLSQLYTEVFKKKSNMLNGCGSCALREIKELGKTYFEEKKAREVLEQKKETPIETEVVTKNKTVKRSQKKKVE